MKIDNNNPEKYNKCLVVDDSEYNLQSFSLYLRTICNDVITATNKVIALKICKDIYKKEVLDFVLVDLKLRLSEQNRSLDFMYGFGLIDELRFEYPDMKIIAYSGLELNEIDDRYFINLLHSKASLFMTRNEKVNLDDLKKVIDLTTIGHVILSSPEANRISGLINNNWLGCLINPWERRLLELRASGLTKEGTSERIYSETGSPQNTTDNDQRKMRDKLIDCGLMDKDEFKGNYELAAQYLNRLLGPANMFAKRPNRIQSYDPEFKKT